MKKTLFIYLISICYSITSFAQQANVEVTGKVRNASDNAPLIGVTVVEDGTTNGTVTDIDGNYSIMVSPEASLKFSFVGMLSETVSVNNNSVVNISLVEDITELDEVVVIGYGTVKKSDLTGSVSSVSSEELTKTPMVDVNLALQGKAAGVHITTNDASPGGNTSIRIRGHGSLNNSNAPLYVIDGFIGANPEMISPQDIENIEILKDGSSTAIYGARGANGVVMITTKRGNKNVNQLHLSHYTSIKQIYKKIDMLNGEEFMRYVNDGYTNEGLNPRFSEEEIAQVKEGTDWQDELYKNGLAQTTSLSYTGGNNNTQFAIMGNYNTEDGIIPSASYNKVNTRLNVDHSSNDRFKIGANLAFVNSERNSIVTDGKDGWDTGPITSALRYWPIYSVKDSITGEYFNDGLTDNPIAAAEMYQRNGKNNAYLGNGYLEFQIIEGLKIKTNLGANYRHVESNSYDPVGMLASNGTGEARLSSSNSRRWFGNLTLNFNKTFAGLHNIATLAGVEQEVNSSTGMTMQGIGFTNNTLSYYNITRAEDDNIFNFYGKSVIKSAFFRLQYSYNNKYLLTSTVRRDGSSKFGKNNKWGTFPSLAAAWKVHQEKFIQDLGIFDIFKIRASWGLAGNDRISSYQSLGTINPASEVYLFGNTEQIYSGGSVNNLPNAGLKWETAEHTDLGMELGFFDNKLALVVDFYRRLNSNLLWRTDLPGYSGYNNYSTPGYITANIGKMENKGMELAITYKILSRSIHWESSFNISFNRNEVLDLGKKDYMMIRSGNRSSKILRLEEGLPIGTFWGHYTNGIWETEEELANNPHMSKAEVGNTRYMDVNFDGVVASGEDQGIIGNALPKYTWGWSNSVSFKNFDFYIFLNGSQDFDVFNANIMDIETTNAEYNCTRDVLNFWKEPGDNTTIPKASWKGESRLISDRWIEDGSFIRLSNMQLGYNISLDAIQSLKISNIRLYVSGQNLFLLTKYKGYDPEVNVDGDSNLSLGIDYSSYPGVRNFTFGIDVDF